MHPASTWRIVIAAALLLPLAGCGTLDKVNPFDDDDQVAAGERQREVRRSRQLEVPPDLVPAADDPALSVPEAPETATFSEYEESGTASGRRRDPADIHALLEFDADGNPVVRVLDDMEQTWRQVGSSLEQMGIPIEERNRIGGYYLVRYQKLERRSEGVWGFITSTFDDVTSGDIKRARGSGDVGEQRTRTGMEQLPPSEEARLERAEIEQQTYRVHLASTDTGNGTDVTVLEADGDADDSLGGQQLLNLLYESLK